MRFDRPVDVLGGAILLIAIWWMGCDPLAESAPNDEVRGFIVTQLPSGSRDPSAPERVSPDTRYPTGSRILWVSSTAAPHETRVLSGDLAAAGAPSLSPDASTILFAGRRTPDSRWAIFEVDLRGSKPRQRVHTDKDCTQPIYLSDSRLVLVCRDDSPALSGGVGSTWSLYRTSTRGSDIERIAFGPGSSFDPTLLYDGRILFSMSQAPEFPRAGSGRTELFTVNPDGTLLDAFTDQHDLAVHRLRPRQTSDGGVVFVRFDEAGGTSRAERVEMKNPQMSGHALLPNRLVQTRSGDSVPLALTSVEPLPDGALLIAGRSEAATESGAPTYGVYRFLPESGAIDLVFDDPVRDEIEAIPLVPSQPRRGRPSSIRPEQNSGAVLCYDAQRSDGRVSAATERHPASVAIWTLTADADGQPTGTVSRARPAEGNADLQMGFEINRSTIEEDGSFFVEVPADVPVRVQTLDDDGREISASAWFWIRPGETRACFGCHESRESAPVNRPIQAISHPARGQTAAKPDHSS